MVDKTESCFLGNDRFYSGQLHESRLRQAHDIPCRISHANIARLPLPRKEHRRFEGEQGSLRDDFLSFHRGTSGIYPSCIYIVFSRIAIIPPNISGVHRGAPAALTAQ
jgi:hypothetical protein